GCKRKPKAPAAAAGGGKNCSHLGHSCSNRFLSSGSNPSLSDGTHTIFLAAQSAWATPLLWKSFSRKRYLLSSTERSAMLERSGGAVCRMEASAAAMEMFAGDPEVTPMPPSCYKSTENSPQSKPKRTTIAVVVQDGQPE
ncbi:hypothetical protein ILYODFUR_012955, partial [Ilyodon furcidens]